MSIATQWMRAVACGLLGLLLAFALLPLLAAPASSKGCHPIMGCAQTKTALAAPPSVQQGTRPGLKVKVTVMSGNQDPVGKVTVVVRKRGGGFTWTRTVAVSDGETKSMRPRRLTKRGTYLVTATFTPRPDTIWAASSATKSFTVERKD